MAGGRRGAALTASILTAAADPTLTTTAPPAFATDPARRRTGGVQVSAVEPHVGRSGVLRVAAAAAATDVSDSGGELGLPGLPGLSYTPPPSPSSWE